LFAPGLVAFDTWRAAARKQRQSQKQRKQAIQKEEKSHRQKRARRPTQNWPPEGHRAGDRTCGFMHLLRWLSYRVSLIDARFYAVHQGSYAFLKKCPVAFLWPERAVVKLLMFELSVWSMRNRAHHDVRWCWQV